MPVRLSNLFATLGLIRAAAAALDTCALATQYFGNDYPWYIDRIPFFETSDSTINDVYYYRQKIFRAHQRDIGADGFISTEFLDDVSWQIAPWGSLSDATAFHLLEGRWNRDRSFKENYASFMYSSQALPRGFSEAIATAVWQGYLVDGVVDDVTGYLDAMQTVYVAWEGDHYDTSKEMFWIAPIQDATEYTIASIDASCGEDGFQGGESFRPSINSYQYANALAIANIASLVGDTSVADAYNARAATLKDLVQDNLWNSTFEHFIDRHYAATDCVTYWEPIRGRELVGYTPWTHDLPDDNATYANAFSHILDDTLLLGEHGLRTVEPSYEYYMVQYRYDSSTGKPECQWNGPAWPYQTTQVLTALANLLDHYNSTAAASVMSKFHYTNYLRDYAVLHYNPNRNNTLVIEEDYNAESGAPIVGLSRSPHYFHSGFIDQVLSGFVGIRARDDDVLEVNPLASDDITYFRVENVLYHGNDVSVQWDSTGDRYGTQGLIVEVNNVQVASSSTLTRLTVDIERLSPPTWARSAPVSIQAQNDGSYPVGSVDVEGADTNKIHDTIDGRLWFFTETEYDVAHGYQSPVGDGVTEHWFQIDFGTATTVASAEIAFLDASDQSITVPLDYRIEVYIDDAWVKVTSPSYDEAVANGVTHASWTAASANLIRLVYTPQADFAVRIINWKVYDTLVTDSSTVCT
ncbi:hypothetical protein LQW54_003286 [Pestalotiopsis sp. IQ-011]